MALRILVSGVEQGQRLHRLGAGLDAGERPGERGLAAFADRAQQVGAVGRLGIGVGQGRVNQASASSWRRRCSTVAWAQASRAMGTRNGEQET